MNTFGLSAIKAEGSALLFDDSEHGRAALAQRVKRSEAAKRGWVTRRQRAPK